jgi:hypothetical protein
VRTLASAERGEVEKVIGLASTSAVTGALSLERRGISAEGPIFG